MDYNTIILGIGEILLAIAIIMLDHKKEDK